MNYVNIPLFVPHNGCPHDCVFCNQKRITAKSESVTSQTVDKTIDEYLKTIKAGSHIQAAFFGGSFTGIPIEEQEELLSAAYKYLKNGKIHGIRLSTRPDYISEDILDLLKSKGVTTIELGIQSMNDEVLKKSNRGHNSDIVKSSVKLIQEYGFSLGLQMMTGLPGDSFEKSIETAKEFIKLMPDFVRIYPTLVIKDTALEQMYNSGVYIPQSLEEAISLCKHLKIMFMENNIQVIRVSLQPTEEISENASVVAGPFHSAFGELVENEIFYDMLLKITEGLSNCTITVGTNPKDISKLVGNRGRNKVRLKNEKNIILKTIGIEDIKNSVKLIGVE